MADYIVKDTELTSVANAIRTAGGTSSLLTFPNGFTNAINNISGGGSSDFSTATVTITVNNGYVEMVGSFIGTDDFGHQNITLGSCYVTDSTQTFPIVLTSTGAFASIVDSNLDNVATSGNISDLGNSNFLVTGDCTITIS